MANIKDKIKILHIITSLRKGGAERLCLSICNELVKYPNIEVKILLLENIIEYEDLNENVEILFDKNEVTLSTWKKNTIENNNFKRIIDGYDPHIIHSHLIHGNMMACSYIKPRIVYFSHLHGIDVEYKKFNFKKIDKLMLTNFYEKRWLRNRYKSSRTKFFACSEAVRDYFSHNMQINNSLIYLLKNAINLEKFTFSGNEGKDGYKLINVGTLNDIKNQTFLLKVIVILKQKIPEIKLIILGDGANKDMLSKEIDLFGLKNNVFLYGMVDDVQKYMQNSILYVHSSISEGLPLVFIEAMACGLPVITTDCVKNNDFVLDGINGYIIKRDQIEDFVEKIWMVLNNWNMYLGLQRNAIIAANKNNIKHYVEKLMKIYENNLSLII
jgi:glycosyltransferase involved in cell wall biosynthesis